MDHLAKGYLKSLTEPNTQLTPENQRVKEGVTAFPGTTDPNYHEELGLLIHRGQGGTHLGFRAFFRVSLDVSNFNDNCKWGDFNNCSLTRAMQLKLQTPWR